MFPKLLKSRSKGDNIEIVYTVIDYKLKMMHDKYDKLNLSPMRYNRNSYPR